MRKSLTFCLTLCTLTFPLFAQETPGLPNLSNSDFPIIIDAEESVVYNEAANSCTAIGNARAQRNDFVVSGQTLTVYFTGTGHDREIREIIADGNVSLVNPDQVAYGEHAHYDVAQDRLIMTGGDLKLVTTDQLITARDSLEFWNAKNQGIARGNAIARFPKKEQIVQADLLIADFLPKEERQKSGSETSLKRIEAEGNVLISTPKEIATGKRGVYVARNDTAELFENVKITQGENHLRGEYAIMNMKTNVSQLYAYNPHEPETATTKKRVRGIIIPKDAKKMKDDRKSDTSDVDANKETL